MGLVRNVPLYLAWRLFRSGMLFLPIFMLYILSFDVSYTFAMSLPIVTGAAQLILEMPSGVMSDLFGRRLTLFLGTFCYMLNFALFYVAQGPGMLIASAVAFGASLALFSGTDSAFLYDTLKALDKEEEYARVEGRAFALQMTGMALGGLIGGPIAAVYGMRTVLLIMIAIGSLNTLLTLAFVEPPHYKKSVDRRFFSHLTSSLTFAARHPRVRFLSLFGGIIMALMVAGHRVFQPALQEAGIPLAWFGPIYAFWLAITAVTAFNAKRIADHLGFQALLLAIPLLLVVGYLPLTLIAGLGMVLVIALLEIAWGLHKPVIEAYLNEHLDSHRRATVLSISGFIMSVTLFIVAPLTGIISDVAGLAAAFGFLGALSLAALLWTIRGASLLKV